MSKDINSQVPPPCLGRVDPPRGPEISGRIITTNLKELISKGLSHRGVLSHWDVWKYIPRVVTQYAVRRTRPCVTGGWNYQLSYMNEISSPSHLPLHLCWPKRLHSPIVLCFDDDKPNKSYLVLMNLLKISFRISTMFGGHCLLLQQLLGS